ncbi:MAG TPA: DUF2155 domain-containing protein [Acidocella sp.]|nr:DUF2155 domain-containing protein [Acidocella sp.]
MRLVLLATAATLLGGAALAQSLLGQSQPGQGALAIPPAPPVVAAPPTPPPAPTPAPPAPPPGLVETPLPPPTDSNADNGNTGGDQTTQIQAVSPSGTPPAGTAGTAAPANGGAAAASAQPAPQDVPPAPSNDWVPGKTAVLGVLNKVDGSSTTLTIAVGGQAVVGDLTVSVQACVSRPDGQLPDSAIFLTLQPKDAQGGGPVYRGWMVRSAPGATDAGNAGQAFRVVTCS